MSDRKATMSPYETFLAYMAIATHHEERLSARREHRWKISLALWTVLLSALVVTKDRPGDAVILGFLMPIVLAHFGLLSGLVARDQGNRDARQKGLLAAQAILADPKATVSASLSVARPSPAETASAMFRELEPSAWFQVIVTVLIAVFGYATVGTLVFSKL